MPTASISDTVRVLSTVVAPIVAQGAIVRRPRVLALAERMDADRRAGRLLRALRGRYGPGPLLLRVPGRPVALVLTPESMREVLLGSRGVRRGPRGAGSPRRYSTPGSRYTGWATGSRR